MADDIPTKVSRETSIPNCCVSANDINYILYELEVILTGFGKYVKDFGLPSPFEGLLKKLKNILLMEERNYNVVELHQRVQQLVSQLNEEHQMIYKLVITALECGKQELLFIYVHGGTVKTFLWRTIIDSLRSRGKIVLVVDSSGIASLLLPAGRTLHSRFKLPLDLTDESICHARKHSQLADLLIKTHLIVWYEAPMSDKRCFEALDRTLRDLMNTPTTVFGGKMVILGGDFRQTLPVNKGATKQQLIQASIAESYLCPHIKMYRLKQNMRLLRGCLTEEDRQRLHTFAEWLLNVGNGDIGTLDSEDDEDMSWVTIPDEYCIVPGQQALSTLVRFIYDDLTLKNPTAAALQEKAIVCPKNETVDAMNADILSSIPGVQTTYLSRDEAIPLGRPNSETDLLYPMEYLNTITFPGFPPHELHLKVGTPIMLLRNTNLGVASAMVHE